MRLLRLIWIFCAVVVCIVDGYKHPDYEGDCTDFDPEIYEGFDEEWFFRAAQNWLYVPMASKLVYHGVSLLMDGEYNPKNEPRYDRMCLRILSGTIFNSMSAFGNRTVMECEVGEPGSRDCSLATARVFLQPNGKKIFPMQGTVMWSDSKQYTLVGLCLGETVKMWLLFSTAGEPVDEDTRKTVTDLVVQSGFSANKVQELPYEKCLKLWAFQDKKGPKKGRKRKSRRGKKTEEVKPAPT